MDTSAAVDLTASLVEQLNDAFDDAAWVRTVAIVVDVCVGDDEEGRCHIFAVANEDRPWCTQALLDEGIDYIDRVCALEVKDGE